jgi:hypothetical protein
VPADAVHEEDQQREKNAVPQLGNLKDVGEAI